LQTEKHLPQKILEKTRIVINSIKNGSVIVTFDIVLDVGENITKREVSDAFTEALSMSTVLEADLERTVIEGMNLFITVNSSSTVHFTDGNIQCNGI